MSVDDQTRLSLHRKLDTVLGSEDAATLMAHLPPVTWQDVATKRDVDGLGTRLRSEIHAVDTGLRAEIQTVRAEIQTLRSDLTVSVTELRTHSDLADASLKAEMQAGFASICGEIQRLRVDLHEGLSRQLRWTMTVVLAWSTVLLTVTRYVP